MYWFVIGSDQARQGFDFLGYHLQLRNGKVDVRPADNNLQKIENAYSSMMKEYRRTPVWKRISSLDELEKKFRQWSATFSESTDMERVLTAKRNNVRRLKKALGAQIAMTSNNPKPIGLETEAPF